MSKGDPNCRKCFGEGLYWVGPRTGHNDPTICECTKEEDEELKELADEFIDEVSRAYQIPKSFLFGEGPETVYDPYIPEQCVENASDCTKSGKEEPSSNKTVEEKKAIISLPKGKKPTFQIPNSNKEEIEKEVERRKEQIRNSVGVKPRLEGSNLEQSGGVGEGGIH